MRVRTIQGTRESVRAGQAKAGQSVRPRAQEIVSDAVGEQALSYVRKLALQNLNPLVAILRSRDALPAFRQYPEVGIHWIGGGLGYFYHSHGPSSAEHGHFHMFAQERGHGRTCGCDSYSHLLGIGVDARGAPQRVFTTNLWVTAGRWRCARFIRRELNRFANVAARPDSGPERWIGMILRLFPDEVREVLRLRDQRVGMWRRAHIAQRRLADRRIYTLSSLTLSLSMSVKDGL